MSSLLRHTRRSAGGAPAAHVTLDDGVLRAHAHPCPGVPAMASIVVLDGAVVPTPAHYRRWGAHLQQLGFTHLRTGALAPRLAAQAAQAGLVPVQELVLLELTHPNRVRRSRSAQRATRTTSLERGHLGLASALDRAAFGDRWWLDAGMLGEVCEATPRIRARAIADSGSIDPHGGFLISGRAGRIGYIQRLAVHPEHQRAGRATALMDDALAWMHRRRVERVFVNTHADNAAALALYDRYGFVALRERLAVFEGVIAP